MRTYYVPLTEQEELNLRQMAGHPGFPILFKLLQMEALNAQSVLMECKEADPEARLLALADAQAMSLVVTKLTHKLESYRAAIDAPMTKQDVEEIFGDVWTVGERTN